MPTSSSRRLPARLALCASCLALVIVALSGSACSVIGAREQVRGNMVDFDSLKGLVPGTSTRADVTTRKGIPDQTPLPGRGEAVFSEAVPQQTAKGRFPAAVTDRFRIGGPGIGRPDDVQARS